MKRKIIIFCLIICAVLPLVSCSSNQKNIYFTTKDLKGNYVYGDEIFKENTITVVNVWATWCGPCVSEMPSLQKVYSDYKSKGVTVIGICVDSNPNKANIQKVLNSTGVKYQIIYANEETEEIFQTKYIPATFFVDSNGDMIGEPIIGADTNGCPNIRARLDELLG